MTRFLRIVEIMWAIVALVAGVTCVVRMFSGQAWGSYLYITLFTGAVALFMYFFKKRNRKYMESYYAEKEEKEGA